MVTIYMIAINTLLTISTLLVVNKAILLKDISTDGTKEVSTCFQNNLLISHTYKGVQRVRLLIIR